MAQARNKKKPATEVETEVVDTDETLAPEPEDVKVMELLEELGDEASVVRVYRQDENNYKAITLLGECTPDEFTPIMLSRPPFNGGLFRIHARSNSGLVVNRQLRVAPDKKAIAIAEAHEQAEADALRRNGGVAQTAAPAQDMAAMVQTMMTGFQATVAQLLEGLKPRTPEVDPLTMMERFSAIAKNMQPPPAPAPVRDSLVDTLNSMKLLREVASDLNPDSKGSEFGELASMAKDVLTAANVAKTQQQAPPQNPAIAETQAELDPDEESNMLKEMLIRNTLKRGCKYAALNAPVDEYADEVYTMMSPAEVIEALTDAQWLEHMSAIVPDCKTHKAWFEAVREAMTEYAVEDGVPGVEVVVAARPRPAAPGGAQTPLDDAGEVVLTGKDPSQT